MSWQSEFSEEFGPDELLTIGEVQERVGVSARTLRYYEELELLPGVRRRAGGRRVYGRDELERLRFIQRLKKLGLSLAEIKKLNAVYGINGSTQEMLMHLSDLLGHQAAEVDGRLAELRALRVEIQTYRDHVQRRQRANGAARSSESEPTA